ncbi:MAG: DUF5723 family protein [Prevotellaceae bacterium]|jgi:hypothetical protein|nr:DUF5723 family protein [Prevotellaceae bacterium]
MKNIAKLIALLALVLTSVAAQAQANITLYHMQDLPLNNQLNPAFQPKNGSIYIAIPAVPFLFAPTSLDVSVTGKNINYSNFLSTTPDYGSIVNGIDKFAVGQVNFSFSPISFGFMVKDMYFSLDVNVKTHVEGRVPGDMLDLIYYGNGDDRTLGKRLSMEGLGGTAYAYGELALGFSKEIAPLDLTVGGKVKYLQGAGYAQASLGKNSFIQTNANDYSITVGLDPELYVAGAPLNVPQGDFTLDSLADSKTDSYKWNSGNRGVAFDLGGTWNVARVLPQDWAKGMEVSLSLIDLGFINWKGNKVVKADDATDFTFEGMEFSSNEEDNENFTDALVDSVMNMAKVQSAGNASFRKWLEPTLYFGANYNFGALNENLKWLNAGALFGCRFGTYENLPLFAASVNTENLPVNVSLSGSYFDGKGNLGFGVVFGRRGCQFHIITDNILAGRYEKAQSVNLRMGMNVLVGKTREQRKEKWAAATQDVMAPGEALNPVQQQGAAGATVEGSAPVETRSNTAGDEAALKQGLKDEKTPGVSAEELIKRAMEEEAAEGDAVVKQQ